VTIQKIYAEIKWDAPFANYDEITGYSVLIKNGAGDFVDATLECNNQFLQRTTDTECLIGMTELISEFGLAYPQSILAKIIAYNNRGQSTPSD
jgi:hypothetical protein